MYTKRNYGFWQTFLWSKKPFIYGFLYSLVVALLLFAAKHYFMIFLSIPWQPISVLGITVGFYLGFKNNASYDRLWEARKIWGGIVNNSRTFGAALVAFVANDADNTIKKKIIYRHVAWLTALRYQLRVAKEWEHTEERIHGIYSPHADDRYFENLGKELQNYVPQEEIDTYLSKSNVAVQILKKQSEELQLLKEGGYFDDFRHMELHKLIGFFYDDQGRSERIKNFPFPRQYASAAVWQTTIFTALIPFGMVDIFTGAFPENLNTHTFFLEKYVFAHLLSAFFSALLIWVFFLMEKIGDYSENPFEGSYNDIPITSIARGIEIDLRQMIDDSHIPAAVANDNGFLL